MLKNRKHVSPDLLEVMRRMKQPPSETINLFETCGARELQPGRTHTVTIAECEPGDYRYGPAFKVVVVDENGARASKIFSHGPKFMSFCRTVMSQEETMNFCGDSLCGRSLDVSVERSKDGKYVSITDWKQIKPHEATEKHAPAQSNTTASSDKGMYEKMLEELQREKEEDGAPMPTPAPEAVLAEADDEDDEGTG